MKPALLIIDMSKDFFKEDYGGGVLFKGKDRQVSCINDLVSFFREKKLPIIWVVQKFKRDLSDAPLLMKKRKDHITIEYTDGWEILDELDYKKEKDKLVIKKRYSAFYNTNMDEILKKLGVDTLIIAGVNTHACVRTSSVDAYQRDYEVIWPENGVKSYHKEFEINTIEYMNRGIVQMKSVSEIKQIIDNS